VFFGTQEVTSFIPKVALGSVADQCIIDQSNKSGLSNAIQFSPITLAGWKTEHDIQSILELDGIE
jgi:hypothetical protein